MDGFDVKAMAEEITAKRYSGDLDAAIRQCEEAASRFPQNSFFPKIAGDMYRQNGQFEQAAEQYLRMLGLLQPEQFSIFVKAYRNLVKNVSADFISDYQKKIRDFVNRNDLDESVKKRLNVLLSENFSFAPEFSYAFYPPESDEIYDLERRVNQWGKQGDVAKLRGLSVYIMEEAASGKTADKNISWLLIQRLEAFNLYDQALKLIRATQKLYNKMRVAAILRICRKLSDYSFAKEELKFDNLFIDSSDFNIQYELVYYFQEEKDSDALERVLQRMRSSATTSVPIARTLYNFYLSFDRVDDAVLIYNHIRELEKTRENQSFRKDREQKRQETEDAALQKMKDLSEEREHNRQMIALSDLLKGFSHEQGQPITNIRFAIDLHKEKIRRGKDSPEDLDALFENILKQTARLGNLVARFRPIVSPQNMTEVFSVYDCVRQVCSDLETRLRNQGISYTLRGFDGISLKGDQTQFSQIFYNLINNSMQAIQGNGSINIEISEPEKNLVEIVFSDDGPGIEEEYIHKVFEPFFSTKDPTSGNGGEGLGLYIVWNVLKTFNGKIKIDKSYRPGCRFIMTLKRDEKER